MLEFCARPLCRAHDWPHPRHNGREIAFDSAYSRIWQFYSKAAVPQTVNRRAHHRGASQGAHPLPHDAETSGIRARLESRWSPDGNMGGHPSRATERAATHQFLTCINYALPSQKTSTESTPNGPDDLSSALEVPASIRVRSCATRRHRYRIGAPMPSVSRSGRCAQAFAKAGHPTITTSTRRDR